MDATHTFEKAGLGIAPFKFVGMGQQDVSYGEAVNFRDAKTGLEIRSKRGGTCAFCGSAIVHLYEVEDSNGKRFHVGSECVKKTADKSLMAALDKAIKAAQKAKRAAKSAETKAARKSAEVADDAMLAAKREDASFWTACEAIAHPSIPGNTLAGYFRWLLANAGRIGERRMIREIKHRGL